MVRAFAVVLMLIKHSGFDKYQLPSPHDAVLLISSYRDILSMWVNLYRTIRNDDSFGKTKHELDFLGFLPHVKIVTSYKKHQSEIEQDDVIFTIYYSTKACHKLKIIFYSLPHIWKDLDNFIEISKISAVISQRDYMQYFQLPK